MGNGCEGLESGLYLEITTGFLSSSQTPAEAQDWISTGSDQPSCAALAPSSSGGDPGH